MNREIYNQVTQNAGFVDLSERCWIEVKGTDSRKFLNGILTNNIQTLQGNTGCYTALCTPKGKMIADLYCYTCEDYPTTHPNAKGVCPSGPTDGWWGYFGIDCSAALKPAVLETLKKYIIFQKVELIDQSEKWGAVAVVGPEPNLALSLPQTDYNYDFVEWENFSLWVIRKKIWGLNGLELWVKQSDLSSLKSKLNLPEITKEIQEVLRIESATPLFGVDMDQNTIPQEAGLHNALSFNKGCYVGQEIIARLEHRGHVGKKLVQLKIEGNVLPPAGEKILSKDGQEIGHITSSCLSPKFGSALALGYIRYASLNENEVFLKQSSATPLLHAHRL